MTEIIDLSQEIYAGMPVYKSLPSVNMSMHASHEQWNGIKDSETITRSVYNLEMSEHTGTHVDSISHMGREFVGQSIDTMPLSTFYTEGICLDFSHKGLKELITSEEIISACAKDELDIKENDTVLLYTDHYRKTYGQGDWGNGPGLTAEATR